MSFVDDHGARLGPWKNDTRGEFVENGSYISADILIAHNAQNTVDRLAKKSTKRVHRDRCKFRAVLSGCPSPFRCTEPVKNPDNAGCKRHLQAFRKSPKSKSLLLISTLLEINCLKLSSGNTVTSKRTHTHEAPEATKPDVHSKVKSSRLSNVPSLFAEEIEPEETLLGLVATAEELESAAADVWPTESSALDIVKVFLGERIANTVNGPKHNFVMKVVNSAVTTIMTTDIFGTSAPVQLITILPDVFRLQKSDPVLQLKELILMSDHYSSHTVLDVDTFHKDLKFASFSNGNETVKTANSVKDKCTGLGQKMASIIFTGIKDDIFEIMSDNKTGFLSQDVLPYKRVGLLLHASGFANLRSIEAILSTSSLKTLSVSASDVFANEKNSTWCRYNSFAPALESFLSSMDASVKVQFNNGWERSKPIDIFGDKKLAFFVAAMKKIDQERLH